MAWSTHWSYSISFSHVNMAVYRDIVNLVIQAPGLGLIECTLLGYQPLRWQVVIILPCLYSKVIIISKGTSIRYSEYTYDMNAFGTCLTKGKSLTLRKKILVYYYSILKPGFLEVSIAFFLKSYLILFSHSIIY